MTFEDKAKKLGIKVDGRWSDERLQKEIDKAMKNLDKLDISNTLAMRIWEGQSPSLPKVERIRRIKQSLEEKGLPAEGLDLD